MQKNPQSSRKKASRRSPNDLPLGRRLAYLQLEVRSMLAGDLWAGGLPNLPTGAQFGPASNCSGDQGTDHSEESPMGVAVEGNTSHASANTGFLDEHCTTNRDSTSTDACGDMESPVDGDAGPVGSNNCPNPGSDLGGYFASATTDPPDLNSYIWNGLVAATVSFNRFFNQGFIAQPEMQSPVVTEGGGNGRALYSVGKAALPNSPGLQYGQGPQSNSGDVSSLDGDGLELLSFTSIHDPAGEFSRQDLKLQEPTLRFFSENEQQDTALASRHSGRVAARSGLIDHHQAFAIIDVGSEAEVAGLPDANKSAGTMMGQQDRFNENDSVRPGVSSVFDVVFSIAGWESTNALFTDTDFFRDQVFQPNNQLLNLNEQAANASLIGPLQSDLPPENRETVNLLAGFDWGAVVMSTMFASMIRTRSGRLKVDELRGGASAVVSAVSGNSTRRRRGGKRPIASGLERLSRWLGGYRRK